jgi:antitoxin Phd
MRFPGLDYYLTSDLASQRGVFPWLGRCRTQKRDSVNFSMQARDGPQVVTRRGVEVAVLVAIDEWRRLKHATRPTLKQLLLATDPRFDIRDPARRGLHRRQPQGSE